VQKGVGDCRNDQRPDDRHAVDGVRGDDTTEGRVKDICQVTNERDKAGVPPCVQHFEDKSDGKKAVQNAEKVVDDARNAADDLEPGDCTSRAATAENRFFGFNDVGMHSGKRGRLRANLVGSLKSARRRVHRGERSAICPAWFQSASFTLALTVKSISVMLELGVSKPSSRFFHKHSSFQCFLADASTT